MADPLVTIDPRVTEPDAPGRPLGLLPIIDYDERDLNFPAAEVLEDVIVPVSKYWQPDSPWNQGSEGACVGFGAGKNLYCYPTRTSSITEVAKRSPSATRTLTTMTGSAIGFGIYYECKRIDGSPNSSGTGLRYAARVLNGETGWKDRALEYRWAWDWDTFMTWLLTKGTVFIGVPWYRSFDIGRKETMPYMPAGSGGIRGYHCVNIYGGNRDNQTVRMINSWGGYFGYNGKAIFRRAVLEPILFSDLGAGCMMLVERVP